MRGCLEIVFHVTCFVQIVVWYITRKAQAKLLRPGQGRLLFRRDGQFDGVLGGARILRCGTGI
jgi:hypothetical protein